MWWWEWERERETIQKRTQSSLQGKIHEGETVLRLNKADKIFLYSFIRQRGYWDYTREIGIWKFLRKLCQMTEQRPLASMVTEGHYYYYVSYHISYIISYYFISYHIKDNIICKSSAVYLKQKLVCCMLGPILCSHSLWPTEPLFLGHSNFLCLYFSW